MCLNTLCPPISPAAIRCLFFLFICMFLFLLPRQVENQWKCQNHSFLSQSWDSMHDVHSQRDFSRYSLHRTAQNEMGARSDSYVVVRRHTWRMRAASCPSSEPCEEVGWAVLKCFDAWGRSSWRQWHIVEAPVCWRQTGGRQMGIAVCCSSFRWANCDHSRLTSAKPPFSPPPHWPSLSLSVSEAMCFSSDDGFWV